MEFKFLLKNYILYLASCTAKSPSPVIFMYHSISDNDSFVSIPPKNFELHIKTLKEQGANFVSLNDILSGNVNNNSICITFDDGYRDNLTHALPILEKYNVPATIYIIAGFIGLKSKIGYYLNKRELIELSKHPLITLGNHTFSHIKLHSLDIQSALREITKCKIFLEELISQEILHFSYPKGKFNNETIRAVKLSGCISAVTTIPGPINTAEPFKLHRISIDKSKTTIIIDKLRRKGALFFMR